MITQREGGNVLQLGGSSSEAFVHPSHATPLAVHQAVLTAADFKVESVDLYINGKCNRRCSYCFLADDFLGSSESMSMDHILEILIWTQSGVVEEITLLGGEPALHPDFTDIVAIVAAKDRRVRVVTNGSKAFRAALNDDRVVNGLSRVGVSLDSPRQEVFDALRGRGAYRDAIATIEMLRAKHLPFDINFTVVRRSLPDVDRMLLLAEDLGADRINMHWFSPVGRGRLHAAGEVVDPLSWRAVVEKVRGHEPRHGSFTVDVQLGFTLGNRGEQPDMCAVRERTNLQFFPDGSVFSCGMAVDGTMSSAYQWEGATLTTRASSDELALAQRSCFGCPAREPVISNSEVYFPLCIYNRLPR
jgi:MoaA/NifB/PqqE/SkfB family radical SAM enzyme